MVDGVLDEVRHGALDCRAVAAHGELVLRRLERHLVAGREPTFGSMTGCMFWYAMGRWLGPARADAPVGRFGRYMLLRHATYAGLARAYRRNHVRASLVAQFVPTVRNYLPVLAGALRLPALPFALATLLGATIWNSGFLIAGYSMRDSGHDLLAVAFRIIVIVVLLEMTALLWLRYRHLWWSRFGSARG
ncbi:DedA family protein [Mesorhizobium sp.]|uniref:DedA family protein n=1 Tax=Mesorhizobium sp. TaxID=1871066 RepID=UPI000FE3F614|nr:DedA family protein [Mesorhizobium sp.]RWG87835.1 MAG: DedA family protein [Mesorhizobium sp.]RWG91545.1 MAG: DedA family protein [Mesorhizobium sp.]RWK05624.1 MAG: DedA family protein [Mesorhizobium sp.]RWK12761.1 MAG: DedA family protein [Mesorhizobium sp.]RWK22681.1 MAG: DedA family protein [Mesorhizobium sp.]